MRGTAPVSAKFRDAVGKGRVQMIRGVAKVIPGVLRGERGLEIAFSNLTGLPQMTVKFFPGAPFTPLEDSGNEIYFRVNDDADLDSYPFVVMVSDGAGQGSVAEGNSAPYVIIEK